MRKLTLGVLLFLLGTTMSFAANKTYRGQIMDSNCAKMGNHNAGYKLSGTHTPKDCTLACVHGGAKFVLYNSATKTTYQLDDQTKPEAFAGENVRVIGSLDSSTDTIHVVRILAAK